MMTRREIAHFPLMLDEPLESFLLRADTPENLEDIRRLVQTKLDEALWQKGLQEAGIKREDFVKLMIERSEGNFMYLRHVLPVMERFGVALQVRELPQGLTGYYERHLRQMKGRDLQRWTDILFPVICILAVSKEPLSITEITDFLKRDNPGLGKQTVRTVLSDWREFRDDTIIDGESCYRIYHSSFREFLEELVVDEE
jgi:hypothetical protein